MSGAGTPGQPLLPACAPKNSEGRGARKHCWDRGGCRHVSPLGSARSPGRSSSVALSPVRVRDVSIAFKAIEGVCSALSLPAARAGRHGGAACTGAPHLGIAQLGPRHISSPGGSGTIWHRAPKPPSPPPRDPPGGHSPSCARQHRRRSRPRAVTEAAAAPRDGGFAASCGERGQRQLGQGCAGACPALAVGRGTVGGRQGEGLSQGPR